jgi:hypothetical protein
VVPEMMLGVPKYNHSDCIAYLVDKLQTNGFMVNYTHPNLLMISWKHWIPGYVRTEIKKKANISIDGYGNIIQEKKNEERNLLLPSVKKTEDKEHKPIDSKKNIGIYSLDLFKNLKKND